MHVCRAIVLCHVNVIIFVPMNGPVNEWNCMKLLFDFWIENGSQLIGLWQHALKVSAEKSSSPRSPYINTESSWFMFVWVLCSVVSLNPIEQPWNKVQRHLRLFDIRRQSYFDIDGTMYISRCLVHNLSPIQLHSLCAVLAEWIDSKIQIFKCRILWSNEASMKKKF